MVLPFSFLFIACFPLQVARQTDRGERERKQDRGSHFNTGASTDKIIYLKLLAMITSKKWNSREVTREAVTLHIIPLVLQFVLTKNF